MIQTAEELVQWFFDQTGYAAFERMDAGVHVSSAVRKEMLLGDRQGTFIMRGRVVPIQFGNMGGSIWCAFIDSSIFTG